MTLGLITGWALAATMARRVRPAHPTHRANVTALTAVTALALAFPVIALYGNLVRVLRPPDDNSGPVATVHSALQPGAYWDAAPTWLLLPALTVAGGLLAAVTLVLTGRSRPLRATQPDGVTASDGDHWERAVGAVEASIEAARTDRDAAQRLLFLSAYPDWTLASLDRMRDQLINVGVPADFLSTTEPSGPHRP
ncbi:hypothetical protein [Micromonospora endolithica]|nr:hypothetical protein [Micromonospora endolithica]